ncbi:uncharacterized protein MKK02DRAFT_42884 [Dioszegia hungarica]|uniref:Uncharacterized protein n=1 Tax=Dioszegia hungarica TaxID=4972 RepID=A0AA38LY15_9TREE|nr:uncharacterized protein MKK02DRAFT_42884 [Dioszegia hungarica]KAI9638489.1 hypothetical protein MKK02DRAFT_42884 [Dioszegia hungarica]
MAPMHPVANSQHARVSSDMGSWRRPESNKSKPSESTGDEKVTALEGQVAELMVQLGECHAALFDIEGFYADRLTESSTDRTLRPDFPQDLSADLEPSDLRAVYTRQASQERRRVNQVWKAQQKTIRTQELAIKFLQAQATQLRAHQDPEGATTRASRLQTENDLLRKTLSERTATAFDIQRLSYCLGSEMMAAHNAGAGDTESGRMSLEHYAWKRLQEMGVTQFAPSLGLGLDLPSHPPGFGAVGDWLEQTSVSN